MKVFLFFLSLSLLVSFVVATETTFTPIFCNDYEFTCCESKEYSSGHQSVTDESSWTCPSWAHKCVIESETKNYDWYIGSIGCGLTYKNLGHYYYCEDEHKNEKNMNPRDEVYIRGDFLSWGDSSAELEIVIYKPNLYFCGDSGCQNGVPVDGADGCEFSPINRIVYTSTSSLTGKKSVSSYTVSSGDCVLAFQSGNRHICGYKEESCSGNSDCGGHTYGNSECIGRTLQEYGCKNYGNSFKGGDRGPDEEGWGNNENKPRESGEADFGKRCEIISSQKVQCCGDTDCGTGMFCDTTTFTCKEEVECKENSDCGVSVQCDWEEGILKTPKCEKGKCLYSEENVECCSDDNCEEGGFCNSDYECQKSSKVDIEMEVANYSSGILGNVIGNGGRPNWRILLIILVLVLLAAGIFLGKYKGKIRSSNSINCCEESRNQGKKFCVECGKKIEGKH